MEVQIWNERHLRGPSSRCLFWRSYFFRETHAQLCRKKTRQRPGSMISAVCSGECLHAAAVKCRDLAASLTERVIETAGYIAGGTSYGEPIDEEFSGDSTSVYAVAGGEVTSVGENEEIGEIHKDHPWRKRRKPLRESEHDRSESAIQSKKRSDHRYI